MENVRERWLSHNEFLEEGHAYDDHDERFKDYDIQQDLPQTETVEDGGSLNLEMIDQEK